MPHITADRVKQVSSTTGAGSYALGATPPGFSAFSPDMAINDTCYYAAVDQAGNGWEVGIGTLSATSTLARTTILASSNAGAAVNWASGVRDVFITYPARVAGRVIAPGSSKVSVVNADGINGNPTIDVVEANLTLSNLGGTLSVAKGGTGGADAATARTNLGLGSIATQAANSVAITGGNISGIADLAVADGGTGASSAPVARSNLGAAAAGSNSDITSLSGLTTPLSIAQGGTGANTQANARTSLGLGTAATMAGPAGAIVGTTDTQTLTTKTIEAGVFTNGYTEETVTANTGTAYTIDLANGTVQILTLTGNCTFTFPATTAGRSFILLLRQDVTGGRTATWPASVRWPGGTAPTITSTASRTDKYVFTADGTNWLGSNAGQNYAA